MTRGYKIGDGAFTTINDTTDVPANLREVITYSRYQNLGGYVAGTDSAFPGNVSRTIPERNDTTKYSWMKAPRYTQRRARSVRWPAWSSRATWFRLDACVDCSGLRRLHGRRGGTEAMTGLDPEMIGPTSPSRSCAPVLRRCTHR